MEGEIQRGVCVSGGGAGGKRGVPYLGRSRTLFRGTDLETDFRARESHHEQREAGEEEVGSSRAGCPEGTGGGSVIGSG